LGARDAQPDEVHRRCRRARRRARLRAGAVLRRGERRPQARRRARGGAARPPRPRARAAVRRRQARHRRDREVARGRRAAVAGGDGDDPRDQRARPTPLGGLRLAVGSPLADPAFPIRLSLVEPEHPSPDTEHESLHEETHLPPPTLWPIGFAIGIVVILVGLVIDPLLISTIGAVIALVFGILWVRDATAELRGEAIVVEPERRDLVEGGAGQTAPPA